MQGPGGGRRDLLRGAAALLADALLPRGAAAQAARERPKPDRRAIVVTFGGGVRWEETFAPEGWTNIPHLVSDLVPQGLFYPEARYEGLTGHFNATGALVTGCLQNVDAYGGEAPTTPTVFECFRKQRGLAPEEAWVVASNKSFGLLGGSKLRDYGDPWSANVILPKQFLVETIKSAVSTEAGPGVEDRQALAERMVSALDEGYEGFGWRVFESGRVLAKDLKTTLARSLLDYFDDPMVPTSGDELTFFMTKEIMSRLAPSLLVVNFWDVDIAHYGAYSLHLEAIRRTDLPAAVRLAASVGGEGLLREQRGLVGRLPVPFRASRGVETERWPPLFAPEKAYLRALLERLAGLTGPDLAETFAGLRRVETEAGCAEVRGGDPRQIQEKTQALLRRKGLFPLWRREVDQVFQRLQPQIEERLYPKGSPRRLVVVLYGQGIAIQRDQLWRQLRAIGTRVPLRLEGATSSEPFLRALFAGLFSAFGDSAGLDPREAWIVEAGDTLHALCQEG